MAQKLNYENVLGRIGQRATRMAHIAKACWRRKRIARVSQLVNWIPANGVIFDIGANFGYYAKEFARMHNRSCQVHAFEPVRYNYTILRRAVRGCSNIAVNTVGLADNPGSVPIYIPVKASGKIGPGIAHLGIEDRRDYVCETISLITMDEYVEAQDLQRLDFIKCDVEGAERLVFLGAQISLARFKPAIYCEVDESYTRRLAYAPDLLFDDMHSLGYRAHTFDPMGGLVPKQRYDAPSDYFFLHEDSLR